MSDNVIPFKDPSNDYDNDYDEMEFDEKFDKVNDYLSEVLGYSADGLSDMIIQAVKKYASDHYNDKLDNYDFGLFTTVSDLIKNQSANLTNEDGTHQLGDIKDVDEVADEVIDILNTENPDEDYAWDLY